MTNSDKFRFVCLTVLWVLLVCIVVSSNPLSLRVIFIIIASGIVVFVPIYKKYLRNKNENAHGRKNR